MLRELNSAPQRPVTCSYGINVRIQPWLLDGLAGKTSVNIAVCALSTSALISRLACGRAVPLAVELDVRQRFVDTSRCAKHNCVRKV